MSKKGGQRSFGLSKYKSHWLLFFKSKINKSMGLSMVGLGHKTQPSKGLPPAPLPQGLSTRCS